MASVIGSVFITNFDRGMVEMLADGTTEYEIDEDDREIYTVTIAGVKGLDFLDGKVPVFFEFPEDVYQDFRIPCFVVKRSNQSPAPSNGWGSSGFAARAPAPGAVEITVTKADGTSTTGWNRYVTQPNATPFDMEYEIESRGRSQGEAIRMLRYMLGKLSPPPMGFVFKCKDSVDDNRTYDAMVTGMSSLSELADVADRTVGWSLSITIRGELDLHVELDGDVSSDYEFRAMTSLPTIRMEQR